MSETTDNSDMALRQQLTQGGYEVALLNERQRRIAAEEERDALAAELEAVKRVALRVKQYNGPTAVSAEGFARIILEELGYTIQEGEA